MGIGNDLPGECSGMRGTFKVSSLGDVPCDLFSSVTIGVGTDAEY